MPKRPHLTAAVACLAVAAALTACASPGDPGLPAGAPSPDADRRFYEARCGVCHVPFAKSDFAADEWPAIVDEMAPRSGLTASQRARVLRYLTTP